MRRGALALAFAAALPTIAEAQRWLVSPSLTATETWSDNPSLRDDNLAKPGWITSLTPAVSVAHRGPGLRLSADFNHQRDFHHSDSTGDNARNFLRSFATLDLVEKRVWLEGRANITQERRSAFGAAVVPDAPGDNPNRAETRSFGISPVARGAWGDLAAYQARANFSTVRSEGISDVENAEVVASIRSGAPAARFGWSADFSALRTRSDAFGTLDDRRARAAFVYAPVPQVHISFIAGYEDSDFALEDDAPRSTPGLGVEWSPGPRTQLAAVGQRRFFGTGYLATLRHRTARTAWEFRARRDATTLASTLGGGALTLGALMSDLLDASVPDPVERSEALRRRLAEFGAAPTSIGTDFLTERPFLLQGVDATFALIGARNTFTFGLQRSTRTALLAGPFLADSFDESELIRTRSYNAAWTHRMTPLTSITWASARVKSTGTDSGPYSNQQLDTVFISTRLGPRTRASLGVRRVDLESTTTNSYEEKAVFGSISLAL